MNRSIPIPLRPLFMLFVCFVMLCAISCKKEEMEEKLICEEVEISVNTQFENNCSKNGSILIHLGLLADYNFEVSTIGKPNQLVAFDLRTTPQSDYVNVELSGLANGNYVVKISSETECEWELYANVGLIEYWGTPGSNYPKLYFVNTGTHRSWLVAEDENLVIQYSARAAGDVDVILTKIGGNSYDGLPIIDSYSRNEWEGDCELYRISKATTLNNLNQTLNSDFTIKAQMINGQNTISADSVSIFVQNPPYLDKRETLVAKEVSEELIFLGTLHSSGEYIFEDLPNLSGLGHDITFATYYNESDGLILTTPSFIEESGLQDLSSFDFWSNGKFAKTELDGQEFPDIYSWGKFESFTSIPKESSLEDFIQLSVGNVIYFKLNYNRSEEYWDGSKDAFEVFNEDLEGLFHVKEISEVNNGIYEMILDFRFNVLDGS